MTQIDDPRIMTGERTVDDAALGAEAARLRSLGATYPEIAARQGCAVSTAHKRVQRAIAAVPTEAVQELRRLEDARLDDLWKIAWGVATRPHVTVSHGKVIKDESGQPLLDDGPKIQAVGALLRIQERRAKLHGLDAPSRRIVEVISEDTVDAEIRALEAEMALQDESALSDA